MREAVIVSTARTPIGKAYRGAFNNTQAQELGGHVISEAVKRANLVRVVPPAIQLVDWDMMEGKNGGNGKESKSNGAQGKFFE